MIASGFASPSAARRWRALAVSDASPARPWRRGPPTRRLIRRCSTPRGARSRRSSNR